MPATPAPARLPSHWFAMLQRQTTSWRFMLQLGAGILVLALSPSTYTPTFRTATARLMVVNTWQVLPWFTSLSALLSQVLIRIVVVTAISYGLSQYALQMMVRVLVLELIPLSAAMFVALRSGLAYNAGARNRDDFEHISHLSQLSAQRLNTELAPHVLADAVAVLTLAMSSCAIALVLTYLNVYGFSPWGLPGFTRTVGQVFDLTVSLGFLIKTLLFSFAVAVVPMAASLQTPPSNSSMQPGAVRLFVILLLVEAASLMVKYV